MSSAYRIRDMLKTYHWRSVFFSYCWRLCSLILIVIIPYNIIIFNYYNSALEQSVISNTQDSMNKSRDIFDILMNEFQTSFSMINAHNSTRTFLGTPGDELGTKSADVLSLQSYLKRVVNGSDAIMDASVYSSASDYLVSSQLFIPANTAGDYASMEWYRAYCATQLPFLMIPRQTYSGDSYDSLFIFKQILEGNRYRGVFCIRVRYRYFIDMIEASVGAKPDALYVLSDIGHVLYSTDASMINRPLFYYEDIETNYNRVLNSANRSIVESDAIHYVVSSENNHLSLYSIINPDAYSPPLNRSVMIMTSLMVMLLSLGVSFWMSARMYKSIIDMIALIQDPYRKVDPSSTMGEFFYISESIAGNALNNQIITKELHKSLDELKESQSVALQSQINPHFLFNTLQMVNMSILRECHADNDAVRIIGLLSDLMRCAFDNSRVFISVEEELEYADKYLQIQKIRYKNRLRIDIQADESAYPCKTLKMMCQPLIENCIMHGLMPKTDDWFISVHCRVEDDSLLFEIRDNGVGMSEEKLRDLRSKMQQTELNRGRSIGLYNVNMRLRLLFPGQYRLDIRSEPDKGTVIELRHPLL